jgi:sec-independent protein translocase protein TatA
MGTFSVWHWLIVLVVVLVLFGGGGKIPKLMRDMGKGINAFKKGLKEEAKDSDEADGNDAIEQGNVEHGRGRQGKVGGPGLRPSPPLRPNRRPP